VLSRVAESCDKAFSSRLRDQDGLRGRPSKSLIESESITTKSHLDFYISLT